MNTTVPASQHLRGAAATLEVTWADQNGDAVAAAGAVTVRVQQADGTDVIPAGSSTTGGASTGAYDRALTAANTASLAMLTATWTAAGDNSTRSTLHEIVGGFFFSVADARAFDAAINESLASNARIQAVRREVEEACEKITGVAWVPRYRRAFVDGTDDSTIVLPDTAVRSVRSVRVYSSASSYTAFTATELAALAIYDDGTLARTDGATFASGNSFTGGARNIVIEYEHGRDQPPRELRHAALTHLRYLLRMETTGIPDRATSFVLADGGGFRLAMPGEYSTGVPDVDAVYARYSNRKSQIAGRLVDYDPTRFSLYHGGQR